MLLAFAMMVVPSMALIVSSQAADTENPIRKITGMLEDMRNELQHEADSEGELFEKAMCTCENGGKELSKVIENTASDIDRLTAKISEETALNSQLSGELQQHRDTKAAAEADLDQATGLRNKESEKFSKEKKSSTYSISSLGKAIPQLEGAASSTAFMQQDDAPDLRRIIEVTHYLTPDKRERVLAFMDAGLGEGQGESQGEPSAGVAEVVGVLKNMKDEMSKDLADAETSEHENARGFGQLKDAKEQEIKVSSEAIIAKEKRSGELALSLVTDKNSLEDAQEENADATKYLANLKDQCTTKMNERDMRKKMRSDEIAAISEAIKILTDDDALDIFKKAVPSAALLATKKSNFEALVQVGNNWKGRQQSSEGAAFSRARNIVARIAKQHPSAQINLLLQTLKGSEDPAAAGAEAAQGASKIVQGMVDGMVKVLHDEDVGDEHKKGWCANETETTTQLQTDKQALVDSLEAELSEMADAMTQINEDIKLFEEKIAALDKDVHVATEQRKNEHTEFVNAFATMDTAVRLIEKASTRLKKFYSPKSHNAQVEKVKSDAVKAAGLGLVSAHKSLAVRKMEADFDSFVQVRHNKVAPIKLDETPKDYEKKESGGVIGLMLEMKSDLVNDMTAAETEEKFSAKDYGRLMKDAQDTRSADVKSMNHKKTAKAELEDKITTAKNTQRATLEELQNIALYLTQLHTECDFLIRNFEVRHEGRVEEEVGLEDAKTIVTHEEPPSHGDVEAGFESEHSEQQVDEHFPDGAHTGPGH